MSGRIHANYVVTEHDKIVGPILAVVLIERIKSNNEPFSSYTALLQEARLREPSVLELNRAPVGIYHPLLVISKVTKSLGLPNITSFALSQNTNEVGDGYPSMNPVQDRMDAKAFSWEAAETEMLINSIAALDVGSHLG